VQDHRKTKAQLIEELKILRHRVSELESRHSTARQVEAALRESEERYRLLAENAGTLISELDAAGNFLYANPWHETLLGYSPEELVSGGPIDLSHPDEVEAATLAYVKLLTEGGPSDNVWRFRHKNGRWRWFRSIGNTFTAADGKPHVVVISQDISAQKEAEQKLERANRALRVLSDCNQAVVRATDEIALCQKVCRILVNTGGYRLAWVGFIDVQDPNKVVQPVAQVGFEVGYLNSVKITWDDSATGRGPTGTAIRTGQPVVNQNILTNPDYAPWREQATRRGYASSIALPLIGNSETLGALNIYAAEPDAFDSQDVELLTELAADLTFGLQTLRLRAQHRHAEAEVRRQLQQNKLILNTTLDGYILADTEGQIVEVNPSYCALTGYTAAELTQMNIRQIEQKLSPEEVTERIEQMVAHGRARFETIHRAKDGRPINLDVSISIVQRTPDDAPLVAAFVRDITGHKQAEAALQESLAEKETLIRELYHRTKNNMQVIGSMLSLQAGLTTNPDVKKVFRDTGYRIRSMTLVHQMLYQSKSLSRIKLDDYISDLAQLLYKSYGVSPGKVALKLKLQPVSILIDSAIPCGLLLNELIANALEHAFPGERRGEITVELSRADCGRITLVVADNGVGVPPDFDFDRKDTFGLQALKGIAELQLQGSLSWETEHGLTCRVQFQDDLYDERV